jgi:hypothetical protein
LDKEARAYDDINDSFRIALYHYQFGKDGWDINKNMIKRNNQSS